MYSFLFLFSTNNFNLQLQFFNSYFFSAAFFYMQCSDSGWRPIRARHSLPPEHLLLLFLSPPNLDSSSTSTTATSTANPFYLPSRIGCPCFVLAYRPFLDSVDLFFSGDCSRLRVKLWWNPTTTHSWAWIPRPFFRQNT